MSLSSLQLDSWCRKNISPGSGLNAEWLHWREPLFIAGGLLIDTFVLPRPSTSISYAVGGGALGDVQAK
jgi:hypothetical protein